MTGTRKRWIAAAAMALTATALLAAGPSAVSAGEGASASVASCDGKAFSPVKRNNKMIAKGNLGCRGDVATARLKVCLQQQVGVNFKIVECKTVVRHSPGGLFARVEHGCQRSVPREFRTRSQLFLKDRNGQTARGQAVSPVPVFPVRC